MQLGSEETAGCLDCHVRPAENVHVMKAADDPDSSAHPDRLAYTCRTADCHPSAGAQISSAAIHLNLATNRGVEFFIGALFVLLIISTFGPSVVLQMLEFLQIVVGRHGPRHHEDCRRAKELLAHPRGHMMLKRFTPHQRIQHWILFLSFTALVITGFPIKFADRPWAAWVIDELGGLSLTRLIHRWAGVLLLAGFVYHMAYLLVALAEFKRSSGKGWIRAFMDSPMMFNMHDLRELGHLLAYLLFMRRERPRASRFSLEEKFEYFGVFWGTIILGVSGVLMWANAWTTSVFPGEVLTAVSLIHTFVAFLALLHVGIIHMVGVIFTPAVFPFSPAMVTGNTPPGELAEAHSAFLDEVEEKLGAAPEEEVGHA
jgi:formate dehydrogenase gamma subunit